MSDEPKEQPTSIWDLFNKNRIQTPRNIKEEVEKEFDNNKTQSEEVSSLTEIAKKIGEKYFSILELTRDGSTSEFMSEHRKVYLSGEGGGWDQDKPGDPPHDWKPDKVIVHSGSVGGLDDENRFIHNKTMRGEIFPEFFKVPSGDVWRTDNDYIYDTAKEGWLVLEQFIPGISTRIYVMQRMFDPAELTVIDPSKIYSKFTNDRVKDSSDPPDNTRDLDFNDFEQLQTILSEIDSGELHVVREED